MKKFVCTINFEDEFKISEKLIRDLNIKDPKTLHEDINIMYEIAMELEDNGWIILPMCSTLISEALGADVKLSLGGARIKEEKYKLKEEISTLFNKKINKECKRLSVMMELLEKLSSNGKHVIYGIEGPFSLLSSLIPIGKMFSTLRKDKEGKLLLNAKKWVLEYAFMAIENGAEVISYADPIASIDIIGEKMFKEVYVPICKSIIDELKENYPEIVIHLCGKLTQSMIDTDCCDITKETYSEKNSYGQVMREYVKNNERKLIGHYCLNLLNNNRNYLEFISWK